MNDRLVACRQVLQNLDYENNASSRVRSEVCEVNVTQSLTLFDQQLNIFGVLLKTVFYMDCRRFQKPKLYITILSK